MILCIGVCMHAHMHKPPNKHSKRSLQQKNKSKVQREMFDLCTAPKGESRNRLHYMIVGGSHSGTLIELGYSICITEYLLK